ncbi:MAG: hypothetical protein COB54_07840 [Alphaproteobacteria bacterium]|nr:MAG: hypothetical protein COB54_07840 [Alphaproteobacteria bacterium]
MVMNNYTPQQQKMLRQAQAVIDDASDTYDEILKAHIRDLKESLAEGNLTESCRVCYRIQTQATTFGWPLASEIAGWFKRLLNSQQDKGLDSAINGLFLDSLDILITEDLKSDSQAAIKLCLHIESELKATESP